MGYSRRKGTSRQSGESRVWDNWQRYVKKETQRLRQKSGGQVVELDLVEQEPPKPPAPPQENVAEQPVDGVFVPRQAPVPGVPREEALQVSDDEIGSTVRPYTFSDYRKIRPLTSPDLFTTSEEVGTEEYDTEEVITEVTVEQQDVAVATLEAPQEDPVATVKEPTKEKPSKKSKDLKKKSKSKTGELELFDSVSEHQTVSRQRLTRRSRLEREELIDKLLDPVISLEEASTLIGVCKTTVRRYTNKGQLDCLRTPGQQRRFKLSQVLEFVKNRETDQRTRRGRDKKST